MAVEPDVGLRRHVTFRRADRGTLKDADLRLDDVDAGNLFGDCVLDLDARIDLDEVEGAGVDIHQELHGPRADIIGRRGDLQRVPAEFLALGLVQIRRRRTLHHLLVAPLDRTVALEQMHLTAMRVAEHLHLDMAGALDQLLQIDLVLAEGGTGLALGLGHLARQIVGRADGAHAAAAAAPARLQHHRIADRLGHPGDFVRIVRQRLRRGHDRYADLHGEVTGGDLVAETAHRVRPRSDKDDSGLGAGIGEFRALRQQAIARMDRIHLRHLGNADHLLDGQIALDRSEILCQMWPTSDLIALVGLEPVKRIFVLLGPDRDSLDAHFVGRAEHADGDFRAIGDEEFPDLHVNPFGEADRRAPPYPGATATGLRKQECCNAK